MNVIIVGGGRVGAELAKLLIAGGHRVKLIERDDATATKLERALPEGVVVRGDGTDPTLLERAGVRHAHVAAAVTGLDETNLVACGLARVAFRVPRTVARVNDPRHAWLFTPVVGVDVALDQAALMAHLIAEEMSLGEMMILRKLRRGAFALVEERVHPAARAANRHIDALDLPDGCSLVAVLRGGAILMPAADLVLRAEDEVLAVTPSAAAAALHALLGANGA